MKEAKTPYCKCLYYSANALARNITKIAAEEFAAVDLPPSYAFIVMTVNTNPGIQAGELSEIMMLTASTITRLIEKLEVKGLIKRHNEGRTTLVYPTAESVKMNDSIKEAWYKLYLKYIDLLGEKQANELTNNIYNAALKLEK